MLPRALIRWIRICSVVVAGALLTGLGLEATQEPVYATQLLPCDDLLGCVEVPAGQPIVIGGLFDRTGPESIQGIAQARAAAVAIQDFGSILRHEIQLREIDISCDEKVLNLDALTSVKTAKTPLVGLIGPSCNGTARKLLRHNLHHGLPMISPAATDNALFVSDRLQGGLWQPGFYSSAPSDVHQGVLLAHYAFQILGVRSLLVVDDEQPQRDSQRDAMEATFRIYGGQIVSREALIPGTGPVVPLLERAASLHPDALYLPTAHQDALRLALAIRSMPALQDVRLLVSADWLATDVAQFIRDSELEVYAAGPYVEPRQATAFGQRFRANYSELPATLTAAHAYDAASLLLQAVRLTAVQDSHGNLSVGRLALRQSLNQMAGFPGYTGILACSPLGQCAINEAWGLYRLPDQTDTGDWPPILLQPPRLLAASSPQYLGRIVQHADVRSGPDGHLPILRTISPNSTVQIIGSTPDRAWVQMITGGWITASHLELYQFGLPIIIRSPVAIPTPLPLAPTPRPLQVGDPDWPIPQAQGFRVPDGMTLRVVALLKDGDSGYSSSVPPYTSNQPKCPHCGHIAVRIGLKNTSSVNQHSIYLEDFSLRLAQDREGYPAQIEATALRCRTRTISSDGNSIHYGIGEVTKDLCFAVTDVTRVTWLYNLVYESASSPEEPHDTPQSEFTVHFSLR